MYFLAYLIKWLISDYRLSLANFCNVFCSERVSYTTTKPRVKVCAYKSFIFCLVIAKFRGKLIKLYFNVSIKVGNVGGWNTDLKLFKMWNCNTH